MRSMSLFSQIIGFFRDSKSELKQVNWPSKDDTIRYTWVVIALSAFLALVLGGLDYFFNFLVGKFLL